MAFGLEIAAKSCSSSRNLQSQGDESVRELLKPYALHGKRRLDNSASVDLKILD